MCPVAHPLSLALIENLETDTFCSKGGYCEAEAGEFQLLHTQPMEENNSAAHIYACVAKLNYRGLGTCNAL